MSISGDTGKAARWACVIAAGMVALVFVRLLADQIQGYTMAESYLKSDDKKNEIMYLDRVLNAHIPFSPLERRALTRLLDIAAEYERRGEREIALVCYETARSSRYLARSVWVPDERLTSDTDVRIAMLKAWLAVADRTEGSFEAAYERQMRLLLQDQSPSVALSAIALVSFFLYVAAMMLWAMYSKRRYLCASVLLLVVWLAALYAA